MKNFLILIFSVFLLGSCKSFKSSTKKYFDKSEVFKQNFTGFSLVDLSENKVVFEKNADKYFQPASNNKLFTLYAGLKSLGDSVSALKYITKGDSLIFWGTGDPSLLHADLPKSNVIDFLIKRPEKLFYSNSNEVKNKFGSGWMLEDYNEYYQAEISALPIYGNIIRITKSRQDEDFNVSPEVAIACVDSASNNLKMVTREFGSSCFSFPNSKNLPKKFTQDIPFDYKSVFKEILEKSVGKRIEIISFQMPTNHKSVFSIKSDSLYKRMLLVSDNMIAEQIILLASKSDTLDTSKSIANILKTHLSDLPDKPRWVDGSGLSRYNLTTPRSLVYVLKKIFAEFPKERIFDLMPSNTEGIYAKSGSYSNNYNLSGYLIGNSGKTYAFSFMNNNFMIPSKEIRKEVERILIGLRGKL
jgi:serine-type D-Ala-D-Ala carboxypeptidase/endopeptidase (penicillin-binding protein 4)